MKRILFLLMIAGTLFAQEVKLDFKVNEEKLYIGDRIKLNYTISGGERHVFVLPDVQMWIKDLEIIDVQASERIKKHRHFIDLNVEAVKFDTGFVHIPAMPIIKTDSTGFGKPDTIFTPEKYLYIYSMLDSSAAPVAMTPPLPLALMTWWEFTIALFLLAVSVFLLILGIKHKSKKKQVIEENWETPKEKAEHYLSALEKKNYPDKEKWKQFYLELTYISRDYFENIYFIHLQELTTSELIPALKEHVDAEFMNDLQTFFQYADLVKFAKGVASHDNCDEHLKLVRQIIETDEMNDGKEPMD
ncbi:MAG: hypothetical protein J7M01_00470 [Candidatus Marinimicrobia bacterium]|nr:hypothetical protein [Candidatus Neomarinimicrobiota bacterium]